MLEIAYIWIVKSKNAEKKPHEFLSNLQEVKDQAIKSLRSSFEIEGIFFTDEEIRKMVARVRAKQL